MNQEPNTAYFAILPYKLLVDNRLKPNEKLLFAHITTLASKEGYCFANNKHFSKIFTSGSTNKQGQPLTGKELEKRIENGKITISKWIKTLIDYGYIKRVIIRDEETNEVKQRQLYPMIDAYGNSKSNTISEGINRPISERINTPISEKSKYNNTSNNNTSNNISGNAIFSNNFNKFDNEQENEYIDFRPLAKEGKIGLLGKAKAICQDKLSYLTFDNFDNKKLSDILGSIKANLNAYNKQNNITARVTDESVLKAFKTALNSILNKSEETPSLAYVKSCLTPSLYLDNQSKETGKPTSKPAGKDSGNNYSEYLKIVQTKFPHYQRLTPLDIKHLEQILGDIKGNGGTDIENFKELFENLPAWVLRSRVYQSVGFVASKINELNISLDEQIRSTEGFDFLVRKRGEAAAYELVKKVILKKKNASNS